MDYIIFDKNIKYEVDSISKESRSDIVDKLKAARLENKLTQQDIANATGIDRANIARLESKKHSPSLDILIKYANCMGYKIEIDLVKK